MEDDIKLPPLHYDELPESDDLIPAMQSYARKAIKADRQLRDEPDLGKAVEALKRDKERLEWLADPNNNIGNVQLPKACVERNPHSLRDAIDDAREQKK